MNKFCLSIFFSLFFIIGCQPIENLEEIVFDYNQLSKVVLKAKQKNIIDLYDTKFEDPYIDHSLKNSPKFYLNNWLENNIKIVDGKNNLIINILDASLKRNEIDNKDTQKYKEKNIYLYKVNFLVEYSIYDESNSLLANTIVNAIASTTSSMYISLEVSEKIIDILILEALDNISSKSDELISIHMKKFIL